MDRVGTQANTNCCNHTVQTHTSDWYEVIQPYLMYSVEIRRWFLETVFLQQRGRIYE